MADRTVVRRLIRALGQVNIHFHQAKGLRRSLNGRIVKCDAFFQGNPNQNASSMWLCGPMSPVTSWYTPLCMNSSTTSATTRVK